jgi:hypothetical protein
VHAGNDQLAQALQVEINKVIKLVKESIDQRPESSTLYHMLNFCLQKRGVCQNVLLGHDDAAPTWVIENAQKTIEICSAAAALIQPETGNLIPEA